MVEAEIAALRGEIFGLKIIVANTLSQIVAQIDDAGAVLDEIQRQSAIGIAQTTPPDIAPAYLELFRNAATSLVLQTTEVARVGRDRLTPPERRR